MNHSLSWNCCLLLRAEDLDEYDIKREDVPVDSELLERARPRSYARRATSSRRTPHSPGDISRRYHKGKQREDPLPRVPPEHSIPPVTPGLTSPDVLHRMRPVCLVRGSIFIEDYIERRLC